MAFLDIFKQERPQEKPAAQTQQAEPPQKTVEQMPDRARAEALAAASVIDRATYHLNKKTEGDSAGALRQNQTGQDKMQEALSPTDGVKGRDVTQGRGRSR